MKDTLYMVPTDHSLHWNTTRDIMVLEHDGSVRYCPAPSTSDSGSKLQITGKLHIQTGGMVPLLRDGTRFPVLWLAGGVLLA